MITLNPTPYNLRPTPHTLTKWRALVAIAGHLIPGDSCARP